MLDLFIFIIIGWSLFNGWRAGFLREVLSTAGLLVGLLGASLAYSVFGETLAVATGSKVSMVTNIVAFFLLWIIIPLMLGFAATLLTKVLRKLQLGTINSAAGAGLSLLKYTILLSCLLTAMHSLGILNEERVEKSVLYRPVSGVLSWAVEAVFDNHGENAHHDARDMEVSSDDDGTSSNSHLDKASDRPDTVWVQRDGSTKK